MKILKLILKIIPAVLGTAWVCRELEKKQKHVFSFKRLFILFVLVGLLCVALTSLYIRSYYQESFTQKTNGCGVVFGAAVWRDDIPSHALDDRTQAAIKLYKNGQVQCLVFSGGASTYGAHEVEVMTKLALRAGVPLSVITEDRAGDNTLATLANLSKTRGHVLVSNDFHLARIDLMAARLGLSDYYLHVAPYQRGRYAKETYFFAREVLGTPLVWLGL